MSFVGFQLPVLPPVAFNGLITPSVECLFPVLTLLGTSFVLGSLILGPLLVLMDPLRQVLVRPHQEMLSRRLTLLILAAAAVAFATLPGDLRRCLVDGSFVAGVHPLAPSGLQVLGIATIQVGFIGSQPPVYILSLATRFVSGMVPSTQKLRKCSSSRPRSSRKQSHVGRPRAAKPSPPCGSTAEELIEQLRCTWGVTLSGIRGIMVVTTIANRLRKRFKNFRGVYQARQRHPHRFVSFKQRIARCRPRAPPLHEEGLPEMQLSATRNTAITCQSAELDELRAKVAAAQAALASIVEERDALKASAEVQQPALQDSSSWPTLASSVSICPIEEHLSLRALQMSRNSVRREVSVSVDSTVTMLGFALDLSKDDADVDPEESLYQDFLDTERNVADLTVIAYRRRDAVLSQRDQLLANMEEEKNTFIYVLTAYVSIIDDQRARITSLEADVASINEENLVSQELADLMEEGLDEQERSIEKRSVTAQQEQEKLHILQTQHIQMKLDSAVLQEQYEAARQEYQSYQVKLSLKEKSHQEELAVLHEKIRAAQDDTLPLAEELKVAEDDLTATLDSLASERSGNADLTAQCDALTAANADLVCLTQSLTTQALDAGSHLATLQTELTDFNKKEAEVQQLLVVHQLVQADLQQRLDAATKEAQSLQGALVPHLVAAQDQNIVLAKERSKLNAQFTAVDKEGKRYHDLAWACANKYGKVDTIIRADKQEKETGRKKAAVKAAPPPPPRPIAGLPTPVQDPAPQPPVVTIRPPPHVLSLSEVCKRLSEVFTAESFWDKLVSTSNTWISAMVKHHVDCHQGLNRKDLAVHLYKLHSHLRPGHKPAFRYCSLPQSRSVTWTKIVSHRWILVASSDDVASTLCLYDYVPGECQADIMPLTQAFLRAPVIRGIVFDRGGDVIIAVELCPSSAPSIQVLSLRCHDGKIVFVQLGSLHDASYLRAADGDWVGMSVCKNRNIPTLWNRKTGRVIQLHDKPESQGGCMSMAIKDDIVAVAYRRKMRIYRILGDGAELLCTHRYGASFQSSSVVALPMVHSSDDKQDTPMFALALGVRDGINVYHVRCKADDGFTLVWKFTTPLKYLDNPHEPQLSDNGSMITWLSIPGSVVSRGVHYFLAQLPVPSDVTQAPVQKPEDMELTSRFYDLAADERIPALYWKATRDLDDLRGLAVFGNAFGELAVFDFSNTSPDALSRVFPRPCPPNYQGELVVSQNCKPDDLKLDLGYPFPLMSTVHDDETLFAKQAAKASELSSKASSLNTWGNSLWSVEFRRLLTLLEVRSLYGEVIPLIYKSGLEVFAVGDLFVLFDWDAAHCRVLESTDADDICSQIETASIILPKGRTMFGGILGIDHVSGLQMHFAERRLYHRNRALEMRNRGGRVDDSWTARKDEDRGRDTHLMGSRFRPYSATRDDSDGDSELGLGGIES
ncbi:hypothetical protein EIP91_003631 [Steccherinum ochraceum]|uniref:Uncharacterized protein n=1 Tax=Steccherinum ochraceum TaxID=92696 RepID=A0A4R0RA59_9APHY|nr:hypothetical protein EIP91_003631 [Steccherinum ochraceum]